jgi:hypothetical protein
MADGASIHSSSTVVPLVVPAMFTNLMMVREGGTR